MLPEIVIKRWKHKKRSTVNRFYGLVRDAETLTVPADKKRVPFKFEVFWRIWGCLIDPFINSHCMLVL